MLKTIKLFATLRDITGKKEMTIDIEDGQTVAQMIDQLRDQSPELAREIVDDNGELTGLVHIVVHGRHIQWLDGLETTIRESDIIVLMPPSAGG